MTNSTHLAEAITATEANLVINTAVYLAVDEAENEADIAHQINTIAAGEIAQGAAQIGATVIHVFTECVFD